MKRMLLACGAVSLAALATPAALALEASVERNAGGELHIRWGTPAAERVDVFVYEKVDGRPTAQRLVSQADADGQHVLAVGASRPYVLLRSAASAGDSSIVRARCTS